MGAGGGFGGDGQVQPLFVGELAVFGIRQTEIGQIRGEVLSVGQTRLFIRLGGFGQGDGLADGLAQGGAGEVGESPKISQRQPWPGAYVLSLLSTTSVKSY